MRDIGSRRVQLVEVGPRDGFQSVDEIIPTTTKITLLEALYGAGVRRTEATSFVSSTSVPQMADAADVLQAALGLPGLDAQVLVPTAHYASRAMQAGARHIAFVLSVSPRHNRSNVRRTPRESLDEYARVVAMLPFGTRLRLNVATAFDCPYDGPVDSAETLGLLERLIEKTPFAEIALCDTTGRATPNHVADLFALAYERFPTVSGWALHAHDTYGLGTANVLAAWQVGVGVFDTSVAGLGGCPFAPGATGNVATEDVVWMLHGMGVDTGIDLDKLVDVALQATLLPRAQFGGRVREAMVARRCSVEREASR